MSEAKSAYAIASKHMYRLLPSLETRNLDDKQRQTDSLRIAYCLIGKICRFFASDSLRLAFHSLKARIWQEPKQHDICEKLLPHCY